LAIFQKKKSFFIEKRYGKTKVARAKSSRQRGVLRKAFTSFSMSSTELIGIVKNFSFIFFMIVLELFRPIQYNKPDRS